MANTFKVITCDMTEVEVHLNQNAEEWALHMFLPSSDHEKVTVVLINQRILRMQQLQRGN